MADPSALNPSIIEKILDPNNLVAVVTVGMLYMFYKFTSRRFELEHQEPWALALLTKTGDTTYDNDGLDDAIFIHSFVFFVRLFVFSFVQKKFKK